MTPPPNPALDFQHLQRSALTCCQQWRKWAQREPAGSAQARRAFEVAALFEKQASIMASHAPQPHRMDHAGTERLHEAHPVTVRMHLTQAERDLIVELCLAATLHQRGEHTAAQETYEQFTAENWEQVRSIIFKLDSPDPDLFPPGSSF